MHGTNTQVMRAFVEQTAHEGSNAIGSVYFIGPVLYSYGPHYPMVIRREDGTYLVNIDRYSATTSKHRSTFIHAYCAVQRDKGLRYETDWQWGDVYQDSTTAEMRRLISGEVI